MKFPNKVINYKESVLSKFPYVLKRLKAEDMEPMQLYSSSRKKFEDITEFIDVLLCLYALGKIDFDEERRKLRYVG